MRGQADAVAQAMAEVVAVAGVDDDLPGDGVDVPTDRPLDPTRQPPTERRTRPAATRATSS